MDIKKINNQPKAKFYKKTIVLLWPILKNLSFSHSLYPAVLFEVEVPIWDPVKCHNLMSYGNFGDNICAGDKNKDSCTVTFHIP